MCIKSELKEICLKLSTNGQSGKGFLLTSKVCPQGVFYPCPGLYKIIKNVYKISFRRDHFETCNIWAKRKGLSVVKKFLSPMGCCPCLGLNACEQKKHIKNRKKSDFEEIFFKLSTNGQSDKEFLLTSKFCPQRVVCPCPGAVYMYKSIKMCLKSYFKEIVLKLSTNGQSDKGFLLTATFVPKGLSAPTLGLYICIKALKYIPGPGVWWAFTGPLVLWFTLISELF